MEDKRYYDLWMQLVNVLRIIEGIYIIFMFIMTILIFVNPGLHSIFLALIVITMLIYIAVYGKYTIMDAKMKIGNYVTKKVIDNYCSHTNYFTLHDLLVKHMDGKEEQYALFDHLIITTKGIFVIDTKFYNGTLWGKEDDEEWTYFSRDERGRKFKSNCENPIIKNKIRIEMLQTLFGEKFNVDFYNIASFIDWVDFKRCVVESEKTKCVYTYEIPTTVEEYIVNSKHERLPIADIQKIYVGLQKINLVDPEIRRAYKQMKRIEKVEYI